MVKWRETVLAVILAGTKQGVIISCHHRLVDRHRRFNHRLPV